MLSLPWRFGILLLKDSIRLLKQAQPAKGLRACFAGHPHYNGQETGGLSPYHHNWMGQSGSLVTKA